MLHHKTWNISSHCGLQLTQMWVQVLCAEDQSQHFTLGCCDSLSNSQASTCPKQSKVWFQFCPTALGNAASCRNHNFLSMSSKWPQITNSTPGLSQNRRHSPPWKKSLLCMYKRRKTTTAKQLCSSVLESGTPTIGNSCTDLICHPSLCQQPYLSCDRHISFRSQTSSFFLPLQDCAASEKQNGSFAWTFLPFPRRFIHASLLRFKLTQKPACREKLTTKKSYSLLKCHLTCF